MLTLISLSAIVFYLETYILTRIYIIGMEIRYAYVTKSYINIVLITGYLLLRDTLKSIVAFLNLEERRLE